MSRTALIIVDVQNDFISGSLALSRCAAGEDGAEVVPAINRLLKKENVFDQIVYTMDYHPLNHVSFDQWPAHCIAGTWGAELHSDLNQNPANKNIIRIKKGTKQDVDNYSAFWDNEHLSETELRAKLKAASIETVFLCGLALDFCVYYSAVDAAKAGFQTFIIEDCCRAINPEGSEEMTEMKRILKKLGIQLIASEDVNNFL